MFKTHKNNIAQIKACIKAFGVCYFHGCGNLYDKEEDSDFRRDFTNPKQEYSAYRIKFTSVDQVPDNVEDLDKMLMESRTKEVAEAAKPKSLGNIRTLTVDEPVAQPVAQPVEKTQAQLDEEELQRQIAEEQKNKKGGK